MSAEADLLIVGAGAKAAAIAAKVHASTSSGSARSRVTIVEKTEPAASWLGRNGMTSGEEPLAIPPIKDVGFPYQSCKQFGEAGEAIDAALLPFSWQRYAIERREYARLGQPGSPSVRHRDYGAYLELGAGAGDRGGHASAAAGSTRSRWSRTSRALAVEVAEPGGRAIPSATSAGRCS